MKKENHPFTGTGSRRSFFKYISAGATGIAPGSFLKSQQAVAQTAAPKKSTVSFVAAKVQREAAYQALKSLEKDIIHDIQGKQIVIKVNMGQVKKEWWLNATDVNFVRGILDFFESIYKRKIILAESTAAGAVSTLLGFDNYNYKPLLKEYNVKFVDLNDRPTLHQWILGENYHPLGINIIDTFLDPDVYLISATRLKTHDNVFATLSLKNVVMGSPINRYRQKSRKGRNEKPKMHSGGNRGLSYNMFLMAYLGVRPNLAVLDGVAGMEGSGPVSGDLIEHGVACASTDWLAADRLGIELMGIDYSEVKYLQWCSEAGLGQDDLSKVTIIGPDYTRYITQYKLHRNVEEQRAWIREDYK